jgi:hypothetical protein
MSSVFSEADGGADISSDKAPLSNNGLRVREVDTVTDLGEKVGSLSGLTILKFATTPGGGRESVTVETGL